MAFIDINYIRHLPTSYRVQIRNVICFFLLNSVLFISCESTKKSDDKLQNIAGYLRINLEENVLNLDPLEMTTNSELFIGQLLYEGLCNITASGDTINGLAKSITYDSLGNSYVLHLRKDKRYNNNDVVSSSEVFKCLMRLINTPNATPRIDGFRKHLTGYFGVKKRIESGLPVDSLTSGLQVIDDSTIRIGWQGNLDEFREYLSYPEFWIYKIVDSSNNYIGTGPFIVEYANSDISLSLKKNPLYVDNAITEPGETGIPALDGVNIRFIKNQDARISEFLNGSLDILEFSDDLVTSSSNAEQLLSIGQEKYGRYRVTRSSQVNTLILSMNNFYDRNLIKLIESAIDTSVLINQDSAAYYAKKFYFNPNYRKLRLPLVNNCGIDCYKTYSFVLNHLSNYFDIRSVEMESLNPKSPYIVLEKKKLEFYDQLPALGRMDQIELKDHTIGKIDLLLDYNFDLIYSHIMLEGINEHENWGRNIKYMKFRKSRLLSIN